MTYAAEPRPRQATQSLSVDIEKSPDVPRYFGQRDIRCPSLRLEERARPRLAEIIANLRDRIEEARMNGWHGEVQGLQVSLNEATRKLISLDKTRASPSSGPVDLAMPALINQRALRFGNS